MEVKDFRRSAREAVRGKWKLALPLFLLAALLLQKFGVAQLRAALAPHVTLDPQLDVQEISLMPTWVSAVLLALELALGVAAGWIRIGMYGVSSELLEGRTPTLRALFPGNRLGAGLLMGVLRNHGDGPHFYRWQRRFLHAPEDADIALILNMENHLNDDDLFALMQARMG